MALSPRKPNKSPINPSPVNLYQIYAKTGKNTKREEKKYNTKPKRPLIIINFILKYYLIYKQIIIISFHKPAFFSWFS